MLWLNQQTVRDMIDRHQLAAVRVGRRRVGIRRSILEAFIAAGEMAAVAPGDPETPEPAHVDEGSITSWAKRSKRRCPRQRRRLSVTTSVRSSPR
jgi:excisionase family DNA binding protein